MGYLFVLGYIILVGIATFLMKIGLKTLSPYQLNFLMGIGMLITGVPALLIAHRTFKIPAKELPIGLLIGIMMAAGSIFYVLAFNKLPAAVAAVLASAYIVLVIVLSWIFLKENMDSLKIFGLVLTFIGVLLLTYRS